MSPSLETWAWPMARAGEALEALARAAGISTATAAQMGAGIEDIARSFGLEAARLSVTYADVDALLRSAAPAVLLVHPNAEPHIVPVLTSSRRGARIITPDNTVRIVPLNALRDALFLDVERTYGGRVDALLDHLPLLRGDHPRIRTVLLREQVGELPLHAGWTVRVAASAPFSQQLRSAGVLRELRAMTIALAASFILSLLAWWTIGHMVLTGHMDRGWLCAWALLLATLIPIRVQATWWQGNATMRAGLLLKQRILFGALQLDTETIRHEGLGELLGRVIETDAVEDLAIQGGFVSLAAIVELGMAIPVLALGPAGIASVVLFLVFMGFTVLLLRRLATQWLSWSHVRIAMTNSVVEGMLGHRTRVAQEHVADWHRTEDRELAAYVAHTRALARTSARLIGLLPRGWLLLGLAALGPAFVMRSASPGSLAVGVGGVLLARSALVRLTSGAVSVANAIAAWQQAAPLFHAGGRPQWAPASSSSTSSAELHEAPPNGVLLDVRRMAFRHRPKGKLALRNVTLRVHRGDRLLVEGPSGGGKSTFGSVLAGLREPESGLLLLGGLDRTSLGGEAWCRHIAAAPQFHENHVFSDTLAFNLLMGRRWPPHKEDLSEAEAICRELGLGPLLDRMPGGLLQRVGETGWQLSHGERSRLYMARALLHQADVVILDESFASLDPETQTMALECVRRRAPALVVIAHP